MNRMDPLMPAAAYQTYQILAPVETHWRDATCAEVACPHHERGWITRVHEGDALGQAQAGYIRHRAGRVFTEARTPDGLTQFTFKPGQRCFAQHRIRLDRPEFFVRRGGDWRGDPFGERPFVHSSAADWVDDFATHQQKIADTIEKG